MLPAGWIDEPHRISQDQVNSFSKLTCDPNKIHTGEQPIVHGMFIMSVIGGAITRRFGHGTIARGFERAKFKEPIRPGQLFNIWSDESKGLDRGVIKVTIRVLTYATETEVFPSVCSLFVRVTVIPPQ